MFFYPRQKLQKAKNAAASLPLPQQQSIKLLVYQTFSLPPSSCKSNFFRKTVRRTVIETIAGIKNWSAPKISRQIKDATTPTMALVWFFVLRHCSTNTTRNSAVMEKSIPVELKFSTVPNREPTTLPVIQ